VNYLQLVNEVLTNNDFTAVTDLDNNTTERVPQTKTFINQIYRDVYGHSLDWSWREREGTISIIAGTSTYDLPTGCDPNSIKEVRFATNGYLIEQLTYSEFDRVVFDYNYDLFLINNIQTSPFPFVCYIFNNQITFYPVPDAGSTVKLRYQVVPDDLSENDDTPIIPAKDHNVLIYGASALLAAFLEENTRAQSYQNLYTTKLGEMLVHNRKTYGYKPSATINTRRKRG